VKGGRLKVVNESRYPDAEVEALVRFGLDEIDVTGTRLVAVVTNTRRSNCWPSGAVPLSGEATYLRHGGLSDDLRSRYLIGRRDSYLIVVRVGPPDAFPTEHKRDGVFREWRTWQEAVVGVTAHEGMHVQHMYDLAYMGRRGVEAKCDAFGMYVVRRYRTEQPCASPAAFATVDGT
jgi:hypothetical protein